MLWLALGNKIPNLTSLLRAPPDQMSSNGSNSSLCTASPGASDDTEIHSRRRMEPFTFASSSELAVPVAVKVWVAFINQVAFTEHMVLTIQQQPP